MEVYLVVNGVITDDLSNPEVCANHTLLNDPAEIVH